MKSFTLLSVLIVTSLSSPVWAQLNPAKIAPTTLVGDATSANKPTQEYSMKLGWNEINRVFGVDVTNEDTKSLEIWGVQTTPNLYVVDFPKSIPPRKSVSFSFLYLAKTNADGAADVVSIMTERGEKTIKITHDRTKVLQFDVAGLSWTQDEALTPKSVTVTLGANTATLKAVKATAGCTAKLDSLGGNQYRVTVTPGSTVKVQQFPVFITLEPALPGVPAVINCAVVTKTK